MGYQNWLEKLRQNLTNTFHVLAITLLSLLLPLSFLLLARLSCANYLLAATTTTGSKPFFLFSIILHTNPTLLYLLISIVTITTLIHGLTEKLIFHNDFASSNNAHQSYRPSLCTAWIIMCTLQVCVGLGIEGSVETGIDGTSFGVERSLLSRILFFLGLHETMMHWSRVVVKPVVDDTLLGAGVKEEKHWLAERVVMGIAFGSFWWWRLRDEVESMVVVPAAKRELLMEVEVADFIGWWLYYLVVTVGMIRIVKGVMWVGVVMLCRRFRRNSGDEEQDHGGGIGKV